MNTNGKCDKCGQTMYNVYCTRINVHRYPNFGMNIINKDLCFDC